MKIFNDKHTTNETGLTLIEILVSITIISIIIIVVSFVLLQINRTNQTAEEISEATYIAQTEIEKIYNDSRNIPYDVWTNNLLDQGKNYSANENFDLVTFDDSTGKFFIEIKITNISDDHLKRIIIDVYPKKHLDRSRAKMENIFDWRPEHETNP